MNYEETLTYIHNTPKFARTLGNDLLRKLLDKLGNPQNELQFVHLAGTNGKGSAAIMLSEILIHSGYRVGLFTSPYIERFNERIRINGEVIDDENLAQITTHIRETIEKNNTPVSEFALDTAIAFEYFKAKKCDIVVLETGLGGRLDATNVIEQNLASVIMSIGLDHMQYLGETIREITAEKCGIIKNNSHTVVYPIQDNDVIPVISEVCAKQNNSLHIAAIPDIADGNRFKYKGKCYTLGLSGDFQKYNAATVLETVGVLREQGYKLPARAVRDGLKNAFNPARFEKLPCGIILDGAHNLPAVKALCESLKKLNKPVNLCVAMMEDKDISGCIEQLASVAKTVTVTEIDMPRCAKTEKLCAEFTKHGITAVEKKNAAEAVEYLIMITGKRELACVCGSLYFAGEVRRQFNHPIPQKPYYVYILRCADNSLYTGIATDVQRRFEEHCGKDGKGAKYTRSRQPIEIAAVWKAENRAAASRLEYQIKQLSKAQKEELIKRSE